MTEVWQDDVLVLRDENADPHPPRTVPNAPDWFTEHLIEGEPDFSVEEEELLRELNTDLDD